MKLKNVRGDLCIRIELTSIDLTEEQVDLQVVERVYEKTYDEVIKLASMQVRDHIIDQIWVGINET